MSGILDLVKDLELDLSEVDIDKVISKLEVEDWEEIKAELEQATEANVELRQYIDIVLRVIDVVIEKGIDTIL